MDPRHEPFVTIVIPCYNEIKFIGKCLNSIATNDYPKDRMEVLVIDGMSNDGTMGAIEQYTQEYKFIRLFTNLKKITSAALNMGIKNAKGDLIIWMSAHNEYVKEYISKCVRYIEDSNADAVGGLIKSIPRQNNLIGNSICIALSHPFGVGGSIHKIGTRTPQYVDTAFGICYKREVFQKIGLFNEGLIRGQDMEFSLRLKKAGLKTLLFPDLVSYYYARSDLKSFLAHNFTNGLWAILPFKYTNRMPVSLRHLIPLAFVLILACLGLLSFFSPLGRLFLMLIIGAYLLCDILFSVKIAFKKMDLRLVFLMPLIFSSLHLAYGLGSLSGLLNVSLSKQFWKNLGTFLSKG